MNIIIRTDKQSKGERQIPMTDEQIKRNKELRAEEHAPMIEDWTAELAHRCATAQHLAASSAHGTSCAGHVVVRDPASASSSGHAALSAATARRTDAPSSDEEPKPPHVPDPLLPVTGTLIAAAPPAATAAAPSPPPTESQLQPLPVERP